MKGIPGIAFPVLLTAIVVIAVPTATLSSASGACAYIYMPGIMGSAEDAVHRNWIEVLSCDWGSVPPPRGSMVPITGEGRAGKLHFGEFSFLKQTDSSSKTLAQYCQCDVQLSHIRLELSGSSLGNFRYLVLRKVRILSVRPGSTLEGGKRTEVVTLGFKQVEYQ